MQVVSQLNDFILERQKLNRQAKDLQAESERIRKESIEEYYKIVMLQSKAQGIANVTMGTTVDTVLNTIPNIVVNAVDGKKGKEIAREALGDTGKSLAGNAAGKVIAVGAKAAATGAKGIVEKILEKLDDAAKEGSVADDVIKGGSDSWVRNLENTSNLNVDDFQSLKDNGVVKVNTSGSDRPLNGTPNSYYKTGNGEHIFIYDNDGKLIYDISSSRVKGFKINIDPDGVNIIRHIS